MRTGPAHAVHLTYNPGLWPYMPAEEPASPGTGESPERERSRTLSEVLAAIAGDTTRSRILIADLIAPMHDRALAALLFIFAVPNVLPGPPGTSAILGAPLVFLAAQLALGLRPWLPRVIARRSIARSDFAALVGRAIPWLARAERLLKPRLCRLAGPPAVYGVGAACLLLATILFLPIPLGNMLPAFAICLFALGILERDGVWILAGFVAAAAALALVWGVLYAVVESAIFIFTRAFT